MRYLLGKRGEVAHEVRRLKLGPTQWKYISSETDALVSLKGRRGITVEYVGPKPSAWFMQIANELDIKVIKLDGGEERAILETRKDESGQYAPEDIVFESRNGILTARLGSIGATVPESAQAKARGSTHELAILIFPMLTAQLRQKPFTPVMHKRYLPLNTYKLIGVDEASGDYTSAAILQATEEEITKQWLTGDWGKVTFEPPKDEIEENTKWLEENNRRSNMLAVLILAGDKTEAMKFASFMELSNWVFLDNTRTLMNYRGSTVYIVGGGRYRSDFSALEGLFLMNGITQIDMED